MRIFGPLVWATTSAVTATDASASASWVTESPSTSRTAGRRTSAPGAASSFSTSITSPSATLYCLPPVLTKAYMVGPLLTNCTELLPKLLKYSPCRWAGATARLATHNGPSDVRAVVQTTAGGGAAAKP